MEDNKIIKDQLLRRALDSPYVATEVLGKNSTVIFGNELKYVTFARLLAIYYKEHSEPITADVLKLGLVKRVNTLIRTKRLEEDSKLDYLNFQDELFNMSVDTSEKMSSNLNGYVRNALAVEEVKKSAAKYDESGDFDLVASLRDSMDTIDGLDVAGGGNKVLDVLKDTDLDIKELETLGADKIPMGLKPFDEALKGGLSRGEVAMIAAESGAGKTTTLSNIASKYVYGRHNVLYVSLEELKSRQLIRFAQLLLGMTPKELFTDDGKVLPSALAKIKTSFTNGGNSKQLGKLFLYKSTPGTETVDSIRQTVSSLEHKNGKIDVLILDYPDLMVNKSKYDNISEAGGQLYQDIRKLAQDMGVVCWTATQLNRGSLSAETKSMANVEGSMKKLNVLEFCATVNRNKEEYENGFTRLYIDKLRNRYDYSEDFLYFKSNRMNLRMSAENENERQQHLAIVEETIESRKQSFRKEYDNSKQKNNDAQRVEELNKKLGGGF